MGTVNQILTIILLISCVSGLPTDLSEDASGSKSTFDGIYAGNHATVNVSNFKFPAHVSGSYVTYEGSFRLSGIATKWLIIKYPQDKVVKLAIRKVHLKCSEGSFKISESPNFENAQELCDVKELPIRYKSSSNILHIRYMSKSEDSLVQGRYTQGRVRVTGKPQVGTSEGTMTSESTGEGEIVIGSTTSIGGEETEESEGITTSEIVGGVSTSEGIVDTSPSIESSTEGQTEGPILPGPLPPLGGVVTEESEDTSTTIFSSTVGGETTLVGGVVTSEGIFSTSQGAENTSEIQTEDMGQTEGPIIPGPVPPVGGEVTEESEGSTTTILDTSVGGETTLAGGVGTSEGALVTSEDIFGTSQGAESTNEGQTEGTSQTEGPIVPGPLPPLTEESEGTSTIIYSTTVGGETTLVGGVGTSEGASDTNEEIFGTSQGAESTSEGQTEGTYETEGTIVPEPIPPVGGGVTEESEGITTTLFSTSVGGETTLAGGVGTSEFASVASEEAMGTSQGTESTSEGQTEGTGETGGPIVPGPIPPLGGGVTEEIEGSSTTTFSTSEGALPTSEEIIGTSQGAEITSEGQTEGTGETEEPIVPGPIPPLGGEMTEVVEETTTTISFTSIGSETTPAGSEVSVQTSQSIESTSEGQTEATDETGGVIVPVPIPPLGGAETEESEGTTTTTMGGETTLASSVSTSESVEGTNESQTESTGETEEVIVPGTVPPLGGGLTGESESTTSTIFSTSVSGETTIAEITSTSESQNESTNQTEEGIVPEPLPPIGGGLPGEMENMTTTATASEGSESTSEIQSEGTGQTEEVIIPETVPTVSGGVVEEIENTTTINYSTSESAESTISEGAAENTTEIEQTESGGDSGEHGPVILPVFPHENATEYPEITESTEESMVPSGVVEDEGQFELEGAGFHNWKIEYPKDKVVLITVSEINLWCSMGSLIFSESDDVEQGLELCNQAQPFAYRSQSNVLYIYYVTGSEDAFVRGRYFKDSADADSNGTIPEQTKRRRFVTGVVYNNSKAQPWLEEYKDHESTKYHELNDEICNGLKAALQLTQTWDAFRSCVLMDEAPANLNLIKKEEEFKNEKYHGKLNKPTNFSTPADSDEWGIFAIVALEFDIRGMSEKLISVEELTDTLEQSPKPSFKKGAFTVSQCV